MRGCHHDSTRERKGKGVTKAGTGRREWQGRGKGTLLQSDGVATDPSNMVTFPNPVISSHALIPCHSFSHGGDMYM
jgi:hypothetical protein